MGKARRTRAVKPQQLLMNEQYTLYTSQNNQTFEVIEHYTQDNDAWIKYKNQQTLQEYTCRLEAFLVRFSPKEPGR